MPMIAPEKVDSKPNKSLITNAAWFAWAAFPPPKDPPMQKIAKKTEVKNIHIFPACSDSGMPFGLALWGYHNLCKQNKRLWNC